MSSNVSTTLYLAFLCALIVVFGFCTKYNEDGAMIARYAQYQDVHVMIFVGFGFLMCFLHKCGFTATGHAFLVAVVAVLWGLLNHGFWARVIGGDAWSRIELDVSKLIMGDFAAGAVLISFGTMIGRISADQLLLMCIIEIIFYSINEAILVKKFAVADIGGTMIIHCFGAYFGLACSWGHNISSDVRKKSTYNNKSAPITDTMAMVGTLFLFCFWPSFNSALAGLGSADVQQRTVVNTLLCICCSTLVSFLVCRYVYEGKFRMVEIQNSTIAGGVAIGACADMITTPAGAMTIGVLGGAVSVLGYRYLQPFLEEKINLRDTCGVHNLHGMPSILGAIAAVIVAANAERSAYGDTMTETFAAREMDGGVELRSARGQAAYQLASLGTTLGIALTTGLATGCLLNGLPMLDYFYQDSLEYEGLEGHGTGGRKIKEAVAAMIKFNQLNPPHVVLRRRVFDLWMRFATKGRVQLALPPVALVFPAAATAIPSSLPGVHEVIEQPPSPTTHVAIEMK